MIHVMIGARASDPKIRTTLLMEDDNTPLAKVIAKANALEAAAREMKANDRALCLPAEVKNVQAIEKTSVQGNFSKFQNDTCFACNKKGHRAGWSGCPAKDKICNSCKKRGHFSIACRSKVFSERTDSRKTVQNVSVYSVHDSSSKPDFASVLVEGQKVDLLIDSGSQLTIFPYDLYMTHFSSFSLSKSDVHVTQFDGSSVPMAGKFEAVLSTGRNSVKANIYIAAPGISCSAIIGKPEIDALQITLSNLRSQVRTVSKNDGLRQKFPAIFQAKGTVSQFEHKPKMKEDIHPVCEPFRRIPYALKEEVAEELLQQEKDDIIERVHGATEWLCNMVIIRKPSKGVRITLDLRNVNKAIIPGNHPLPSIDDIAAEAHSARIFSKIDLAKGFLQIPLEESARDLTAFSTHIGVFRYKKLPMGLSSSPSCFQKIMDQVLAGVRNQAHYIDDILVWGRSQKEHDQALHQVCDKLSSFGFVINQEKTMISVAETTFLGFKFNAEGITPCDDNLQAIQNMKKPENIKELQCFLGALNFYSRCIPNYAAEAEPLRCLLRKDTDFEWKENQEKAFQNLKSYMCSPQTLTFFDTARETFLTCDASNVGIACYLSQMVEGEEKIVAYKSTGLSKAQQKYSTGEKEALAVVFGTEKFHNYLYGRKFILRTDHSALCTLLSTAVKGRQAGRIARWAVRLAPYQYTVQYRPGKSNCLADVLSRLPDLQSEPYCETEDDEAIILHLATESTKEVVTMEEFKEASAHDETLKKIVLGIQSNQTEVWKKDPELLPYYYIRHELTIWDNVCILRGDRTVIPKLLQSKFLHMAHEGHSGMVKTKQKLRDRCWFPKLNELVEEMVKNCHSCITSGKIFKKIDTPLQPRQWPNGPWQELQIDFSEISDAPDGHRFLLSVIDLYSKWPEVAGCHSPNAHAVISFLKNLFSRWGIPLKIIADNGRAFISEEFKTFLRERGVQLQLTPFYRPEANANIERFHGVLKSQLRAYRNEGVPIQDAILKILANYRAQKHQATQKSPHELVTGREMRTCLDLHKCLEKSDDTVTRAQVEKYQARMKQNYDTANRTKFRKHTLKPGEKVRIKRPMKAKNKPPLSELRTVVEEIRPGVFLLDDNSRWHISRLFKAPRNDFDEETVEAVNETDESETSAGDVSHSLPRSIRRTRHPPDSFMFDTRYH